MQAFLNRRAGDQMLIGVATRQYARSLDPLGADVTSTRKSASRRFVAQTQAQLDAWRADCRSTSLDMAGLLIDSVHPSATLYRRRPGQLQRARTRCATENGAARGC